jgi:(p)ppGpp synthase/HD superfamily hydrolase
MTSNWSQELYLQAYRFAAVAHKHQLYPGTDLPYLMHLSFVSMEVLGVLSVESGYDGDLAVQCALLHDTIEDTEATYEQLASKFGIKVAAGVLALTKNKAVEKSQQLTDSLHRIRSQPPEISIVKLADRITNLQSPPAHWTKAKISRYRQEAIEIHTALAGASPYLSLRLAEKIENYAVFE